MKCILIRLDKFTVVIRGISKCANGSIILLIGRGKKKKYEILKLTIAPRKRFERTMAFR